MREFFCHHNLKKLKKKDVLLGIKGGFGSSKSSWIGHDWLEKPITTGSSWRSILSSFFFLVSSRDIIKSVKRT
jgi:hypothetical protein